MYGQNLFLLNIALALQILPHNTLCSTFIMLLYSQMCRLCSTHLAV